MKNKIKIYQADDNDALPHVNKFENVISALLKFFKINTTQFHKNHEVFGEEETRIDYTEAVNFLNENVVSFETSSKDLYKINDNFDEVKKHLEEEIYDIYIIDLKWENHSIDSGIELVRIAQRFTEDNCIFLYSHHAENFIDLFSKNKIDKRINTISSRTINENFEKYLPKSFESIRKRIINNTSEIEKENIKRAINQNHFSYFNNNIPYYNNEYSFKFLYIEKPNFSNAEIASNVDSILVINSNQVKFMPSSEFNKYMMLYVEKYNEEIGNEIIYNILDFAAINIFLRIYNICNKNNFDGKDKVQYNLDKEYRAIESAGRNVSKLFFDNDWVKFYRRMVLRRVIILWDIMFDNFDSDIIKHNIGGLDKMDKISFLIQHGNNEFDKKTETSTNHIKNVCQTKLGFEKPEGDIVYNKSNSFNDEKRFIKKYPTVIVNSIIHLLEQLNEEYFVQAKKFPSLKNKMICYDFFDLKYCCENPKFVGAEDFIRFKSEVYSDMNDFSDFDESFKTIFKNNKYSSITELLELLNNSNNLNS